MELTVQSELHVSGSFFVELTVQSELHVSGNFM